MVILVVVLPVLVSAWLLVRSLYRWAGGVERNDGTRFHPGLGMPLLVVLLLSIGGPVLLAEIAVRVLPVGERHNRHADLSNPPETRGISRSFSSSVPASVDWRLSAPEVRIPVSLQEGLEVKFRLIRSLTRSAEENRLQTTGLGRLTHRAGTGGHKLPIGTLWIGTTVLPNKGGAVGLMAVVRSDEDRKDYVDMDFRDWEFEMKLPDELAFSEPGVTEYLIATKGKGNPETAEQLVLTAEVTKLAD
jgi:hypothetical protein